eukprot:GHVH01004801.1.p1 GENE.GHVH01004801.1~~GHVH01004801.1.p1  ORF type:complete len:669 (+),score=73.64 GHVH01004801.1:226-2232(+)
MKRPSDVISVDVTCQEDDTEALENLEGEKMLDDDHHQDPTKFEFGASLDNLETLPERTSAHRTSEHHHKGHLLWSWSWLPNLINYDSQAEVVGTYEDRSKFEIADSWNCPELPAVIRVIHRFTKPYPFSLDPTRKFLRSIFNMSKNEMYTSTSSRATTLKQLRSEFCLCALFNGLKKKKRHTLRSDHALSWLMVTKPGRDEVLKNECDRREFSSTNDELVGICDAVILAEPFDIGSSNELYLVRVLPSDASISEAMMPLCTDIQTDTDTLMEQHESLLKENLANTSIMSTIIATELQCHRKYRHLRRQKGQIVTTIVTYFSHLGNSKEQTISWFLFVTDDRSWSMTPMMSGIISLQQLFLSILCGGNRSLDHLSIRPESTISDHWIDQCSADVCNGVDGIPPSITMAIGQPSGYTPAMHFLDGQRHYPSDYRLPIPVIPVSPAQHPSRPSFESLGGFDSISYNSFSNQFKPPTMFDEDDWDVNRGSYGSGGVRNVDYCTQPQQKSSHRKSNDSSDVPLGAMSTLPPMSINGHMVSRMNSSFSSNASAPLPQMKMRGEMSTAAMDGHELRMLMAKHKTLRASKDMAQNNTMALQFGAPLSSDQMMLSAGSFAASQQQPSPGRKGVGYYSSCGWDTNKSINNGLVSWDSLKERMEDRSNMKGAMWLGPHR